MPPLMGRPMPPPMPGQQRQPSRKQPSGWREQWMRNFGMDRHSLDRKSELFVPKWVIGRPLKNFIVNIMLVIYWGA